MTGSGRERSFRYALNAKAMRLLDTSAMEERACLKNGFMTIAPCAVPVWVVQKDGRALRTVTSLVTRLSSQAAIKIHAG